MQKFYCDNCGTKVSRDTAKCPKCGRFFKSVRCPSCGLTGSPDLFVNGCPSCGYAEEKKAGGFDYYDISENGRTDKNGRFKKSAEEKEQRFFSDRFYKRAIPLLLVVIVLLVILLLKTGW